MFRIKSIIFCHKEETQQYEFGVHTFIYGANTVGKTALTKAIDFVLGSSGTLSYDGLDHIEAFEMLITNENTELWIKRSTINNDLFYRNSMDEEYMAISLEMYKSHIDAMICNEANKNYVEIFKKIYGENLTFRSLTFLNFLEEQGLGDLDRVFTKANERKHQERVINIMKFFFNFKNIEAIYDKQLELENLLRKKESLKENILVYESGERAIKNGFLDLKLPYVSNNHNKNSEVFESFKKDFHREKAKGIPDFTYLSQASFSLSEEIKMYEFMEKQSTNMRKRKNKSASLLTTLSAIVSQNPSYAKYLANVEGHIREIEQEDTILDMSNYDQSIEEIRIEKEKIDSKIREAKAAATELDYDNTMKKIGIVEEAFSILEKETEKFDISEINKQIGRLKSEIKNLNKDIDQEKIDEINQRITEKYLDSDPIIKHIEEDRKEQDFSIIFDPIRLLLRSTRRNQDGIIETYMPGSNARQTHIQIITYLCMLEYLNHNFPGFACMPFLVMDSANQPMTHDNFEKIYPEILSFADEIGLQTIFLSKEPIGNMEGIKKIDVSNGLNKFHKEPSNKN